MARNETVPTVVFSMSILIEKADVVIVEAPNISDCASVCAANIDLGYMAHETLRTLNEAITEYLREVDND